MAVLKKSVVLFSVLTLITIILACYFNYRYKYLLSYCEVGLEEIAQYNGITMATNTPRWVPITTQEQIKNIQKKYSLELPQIDFEKDMLIISYGAELVRLDYNLKEFTYKTRGHYIGFPDYGGLKQNALFVYKTQLVPLFDTDAAGVAPDYRGKYRK